MSDTHASTEQKSNPPLWWLVCLGPTLVLVAVRLGSTYGGAPPAMVVNALTVPMVIVQLLMLPFLGGYTYRVSHEGIAVFLGLLSIPVKRLAWSAVQSVEVMRDLQPLSEFMGYGLRTNRGAKKTGYVLSSGDAVRVVAEGWTYFLVMPNASDFAAAAERWRARIAAHPAH